MAIFFYWYRYVPDAQGKPDLARSDHFFISDPVTGLSRFALSDEFPETIGSNPGTPYLSVADWAKPDYYRIEFSDMASAQVDIALMETQSLLPLCVYRDYSPIYAYGGVPVAASVVREMQAAGKPCPKLAMFWDAGTLNGFDLTTGFHASDYVEAGYPSQVYTHNAWGAWIQVREFFRSLGATNADRAAVWGTVDGRPIITLYSKFVTIYNQAFFTWLSNQFLQEFGVRPYVILDASWSKGSDGQPVRMDAVTQWGAAIDGPTDLVPKYGGDRIVSVGPGCDASMIPFRWGNKIRLREDGIRGEANPTGTFYDFSWQHAMAMNPRAIIVETWNERHEGTSVARTPEWGDSYIKATAHYAGLFHAGQTAPVTTTLFHPDRLRLRLQDGPEFAGRQVLRYTAATDTMLVDAPLMFRQTSVSGPDDGGLWIVRCPNAGEARWDGTYLRTMTGAAWSFINVQVADTWGFDLPDNSAVKVRLKYIDDRSIIAGDPPGDNADIYIQYDSWNPLDYNGVKLWPGGNAYITANHLTSGLYNTITDASGAETKNPWGVFPLTGSNVKPIVKTITWNLERPRFGNRQDTGGDFQIIARVPARTMSDPLKIISVEVEAANTTGFAAPSVADVVRSLQAAAGLCTTSEADLARLDADTRGQSAHRIDMADAIALARQVVASIETP